MARPKGSKNKSKEAGNPDFNLNDVEPTNVLGVLPEDLELERTLQGMVSELPVISDPEPIGGTIKREVEVREMLADHVSDYKPADSLQELQDQVSVAKAEGCDSIEATEAIAKRLCRDPQLVNVGYFIYHGIKVYLSGAFERARKRDRQSIETRMFGNSLANEAERKQALRDQISKLEKQLSE